MHLQPERESHSFDTTSISAQTTGGIQNAGSHRRRTHAHATGAQTHACIFYAPTGDGLEGGEREEGQKGLTEREKV